MGQPPLFFKNKEIVTIPLIFSNQTTDQKNQLLTFRHRAGARGNLLRRAASTTVEGAFSMPLKRGKVVFVKEEKMGEFPRYMGILSS
jgi:hypothetical protein